MDIMSESANGIPSLRSPHPSISGQLAKVESPVQSESWPRNIAENIAVTDKVHLHKAENAWQPRVITGSQKNNSETQTLFRKVCGILNKLTPQMFNQLMKQMTELTVDTEERLKGVIDLIFEKAIAEPNFSVTYAKMCQRLSALNVPMTDKPGSTVKFWQLLTNHCQLEFEKSKADHNVWEKKHKELEVATTLKENSHLRQLLEESKNKARRRTLGTIKFIGELFKQNIFSEDIMHDYIVRLLNNCTEESLECLCCLLTTIGKDLDFDKPRIDQYFFQMEKFVKEKKVSSRIRFMLQDLKELRQYYWVPRRANQEPKTIEQIHKEAKIEKQEKQRSIQQRMTKDRWKPEVQRDEANWNVLKGAKSSQVQDYTKMQKPTTFNEKNDLLSKPRSVSWESKGSRRVKATETDDWWPMSQSHPFSSKMKFSRMWTSHENMGHEKNAKSEPLFTSVSYPSSFPRGRNRKDNINRLEDQRRGTVHMSKQMSFSNEQDLVQKVRQPGHRARCEENEVEDTLSVFLQVSMELQLIRSEKERGSPSNMWCSVRSRNQRPVRYSFRQVHKSE